MRKFAIIIIFELASCALFSQSPEIRCFRSDSCYYDLWIHNDGAFYISKADSFNDVVEAENKCEGYWSLKHDTLILSDTSWPLTSHNRITTSLKMIDTFTLMNISIPDCKPGQILYVTYIFDKKNKYSFRGEIKNGKINGDKDYLDENESTLKIEKVSDKDISDFEKIFGF